ncbi:MAG: LD-carboxypeptidase [Bacteroides sp.]|nr:LD-carboxypeptidase [Bacteroides sp.]MCM1471241.1 LD-carboxypeptidase [Bacteroides sp.]
MEHELIVPPTLRSGSKIAILSPAGIARENNVERACEVIRRHGWTPVIGKNAMGRCGSYSGTVEERFDDLRTAFLDKEIEAIICTRGGYGSVQLLEQLDRLPLRQNPKWLVGFSDISALHALMQHHGIASIHGPMTKYISANDGFNEDFEYLCALLEGHRPCYEIEPHPLNRLGEAAGWLTGGNMAVLGGLSGTRFDAILPGSILVIEDIAEPIYKINRQLWQLRINGVLPSIAGLLVGDFTDYRPDANYEDMYSMIRDMVDDYNYPVAFGIPVGHNGRCLPLPLGMEARLRVNPTGVRVCV